MSISGRAVLLLALGVGNCLCSLLPRQDQGSCINSTDCYPPGLPGGISIPESLVVCAEASCVCRDCFELNATSGLCQVDEPCQSYDIASQECDDDRRSQKIAFLLSVFLSCTGAANFYIERLELAIPQLLLLVVLFVCALVAKILHQFADREKLWLTVTAWVSAIVAILAAFTMLAWWIADMVIFLMNDRDDGDDCPLDGDL